MNRDDPGRPRIVLRPLLAAKLLTLVAIGLAFALIFLPPLQAKFVSDTFVLYQRALAQSPQDLVRLFVPQSGNWYRPLTDIVFWLEVRAFGPEAIGYHVVTLTAYVVSAALAFLLAERLSGSRKAALLAALVFLANPHAQEPLWDIADLHTVLAAPILLACLLSYSAGRRRGALLLALLALGVDEAGLLAFPIIGLYELIVVCPNARWGNLKPSLIRLAPFAVVAGAYLAMRMLGGSVYVEGDPCRTPKCLVVAAGEYFNRFLIRPELLLNSLWTHRWIYVGVGLLVVALILLLTRPWAWREKRTTAFVLAWLAVATSFFILSLWPYVTDRFVYIPDSALAVLIGVIAARSAGARLEWSPFRKWASYAAAGLAAAWIAAGLWMLVGRGQLWIGAGNQAASIVSEIHALVPNPPQGAVFVVRDVPVMASPGIPPGNTGPYLYNNGLPSAVGLEYGRSDLKVVVGRDNQTPAPAGAFVFDIQNGSVVLVP